MKLQVIPVLKLYRCLLRSISTLRHPHTDLHVPVEEAVFVHERQALQHLVHDVADHRLRENLVPAVEGAHSAEPAPVLTRVRGW